MKNQGEKLLKMTLITIFCLIYTFTNVVCMYTKRTIPTRDPAHYGQLTTKLQQVKLHITSIQKTKKKLLRTYPISSLAKVIQQGQARMIKQKQQYNRATQRKKQQQHKSLKEKKLKLRLAQKQQLLHHIKEKQKHMEAQPIDAPLGDQFIKFYSTQQQKRAELQQKKTWELHDLERNFNKTIQNIENQQIANLRSIDQKLTQQYFTIENNIIKDLVNQDKKKIFEQLKQNLDLGKRLTELEIKSLELQIQLQQ